MVNVGISSDDYSLLNPCLRNASFHSLQETEQLRELSAGATAESGGGVKPTKLPFSLTELKQQSVTDI